MGELSNAKIKIDFKIRGNYLAQVTLSWDEYEMRYFRITATRNGLWFQSPATGQNDKGLWFKCFIVKDKSKWHELQRRAVNQFLMELEQKVKDGVYAPELLERYKNMSLSEEIDVNQVDKEIQDIHL